MTEELEKDINEYPPVEDVRQRRKRRKETLETVEAQTESVELSVPTKPETKVQYAKCKVSQPTFRNRVGFNFEGYGISLETEKYLSVGEECEIAFEGRIGEPNFNCWLI